jgi:hypothetical protein
VSPAAGSSPVTSSSPAAVSPRERLVALIVFAAAMGWLEGVVVVYIRTMLGIAHGPTFPPQAEIMARMAALPWLVPTEQTREAATLIMLAAAAWLAGRGSRARFGAFLVAFGVWDIVYYVALYAMLRWPPSLATMDLLFLIPPGPWWYQPVWLPVLISCGMIAGGVRLMGLAGGRRQV